MLLTDFTSVLKMVQKHVWKITTVESVRHIVNPRIVSLDIIVVDRTAR